MVPVDIARTVVRLGRPDGREEAASVLARQLGAEALYLLVADPELGVLLPAPGTPQTLRGGPAWRRLLQELEEPGRRRGEIDLPPGSQRPGLATRVDDLALVALGTGVDEELLGRVEALLPLLSRVLAGEMQVRTLTARHESARLAARRARSLAESLDAARAKLASLNSRLQQQDRRKDEFLAMLAHELRNPLAPISAAVEVLLRRGGAPSREQLDMMSRQVHQLARLIEDLLDVARINRGRIALRRQPMRLGDAIDEAVEEARPIIRRRRHTLEIEKPDEPLWIYGDAVRVTQIVSNLLHNAAKFTQPGGELRVELRADAEDAVIQVIDDGAGMSAATLAAAFDPFRQGFDTADRPQAGLGLGLSLVRSLVDLHDGRVDAESEGAGKGTTLSVRLPLIEPPAREEAPERVVSAPTAAARRVLVVDDNRDAAEALSALLELHGHRPEVVHSGLAALEMAADMEFDLVLLDIGLPGMDGYEAARRLRRLLPSEARIVAVTGYGSDRDRERSSQAGIHAHLVKPLDPGDLYRLLEEC